MTADAHELLRSLQEHEADWTIAWLIAHADPELWAPRQFIIVDELTKGSPTLAATWRAIYRLWIFYRPLGRRRFGLRMIAAVGGVGRGHLSGRHGAIRKLKELGLISVSEISDSPRDDEARSDRWEYDIDPARLEALSIRLIRSRISIGQLVARRRPEIQQRDLCAALDLAPAEAMLDLAGASDLAQPFIEFPAAAPSGASNIRTLAPNGASDHICVVAVGNMTPDGASAGANWHPTVPHMAPVGAALSPAAAPISAAYGQIRHHPGPDQGQMAPVGATLPPAAAPLGDTWPPAVPQSPATVAPNQPDLAPVGAHGWREGERERRREGDPDTHTPFLSLQTIEQLIERTLARQLAQLTDGLAQHQAVLRPAPVVAPPVDSLLPLSVPVAPPMEPPLPLALLPIWETVGQRRPVPEHDLIQLRMLIERYQEPAQGHGAYWLGRVMLFADMCRNDAEPIKLKLINSYMRRMADVGFSTETLEDRSLRGEKVVAELGRAERRQRPPQSDLPVASDVTEHPAIAAYAAAFGRAPNRVQAAQIAESVADLATWQRVLTDWQANGWQAGGVAKMLDRYRKENGIAVAVEQPVSVFTIHTYPDLSDAQRDGWVRRFHAAATAAEKRAILKRLEQEHPRADA
jgi:hypothetical protein